MFLINNTFISSTAYTKNEMLAKKDTQQFKENFNINIAALVLLKTVKGIVIDTITPTFIETLLSTVCCFCVSLKRLA
jgi:hypothetical protein